MWKKDDLHEAIIVDKLFLPDKAARCQMLEAFEKWESALARCLRFYE